MVTIKFFTEESNKLNLTIFYAFCCATGDMIDKTKDIKTKEMQIGDDGKFCW